MAPDKCSYTLRLLFDTSACSPEGLRDRVNAVLSSANGPAGRIRLSVETEESGYPVLTVSGSLSDVDESHARIVKQVVEPMGLPTIRLLDEAGEKIRARAYPLVSQVELLLRRFVDHGAISIQGFSKWRKYLQRQLDSDIQRVYKADPPLAPTPLECTQMDSLVELVAYKKPEWGRDLPLTARDLLDVLEEACSVSDIRERVRAKLDDFPTWDRVFALFFAGRDEWDTLKDDLDFVVKVRNCVMHHRPMRLGILTPLEEKAKRISETLESISPRLPDDKRQRAREQMERLEKRSRETPSTLRVYAFEEVHMAEHPGPVRIIRPQDWPSEE